MILRQIAHARAGDKGRLVNISVIAYRAEDYPLLVEQLTVQRVTALFAADLTQPVTRYCIPGLQALNFVLHRRPEDSVTRSLRIDTHGKSLSFRLLSLPIHPTDAEERHPSATSAKQNPAATADESTSHCT